MTHNPKYAIFTAGRTGSQIVSRNLTDYHNCEQYIPRHHNIVSGVVHSHYSLWEPPDSEWICILSKRRNDFEAMCSNYIAKQTQEFIEYTDLAVPLFDLDYEDFVTYFKYRRLFYQTVDQTKFSKTITVWYEDLVTDPNHLFDQLGMTLKTDLTVLTKSPYDYKKIIKNWQQALGWYTELLGNLQFTQDDLDLWANITRKNF